LQRALLRHYPLHECPLHRLSRGETTGTDVVMIGVQELSKAKEAREEKEDKLNTLMSESTGCQTSA
jgi:hypothetical protein